MLKIDRLRLALPADQAPRAGRIARLVADELAGLDSSLAAGGAARRDHLAVPPVAVARGAADAHVAGAVAAAIATALKPAGAGKP